MRFFVVLLLTMTSLMADYTAQPLDQKLLNSNIKIIDIRTPAEWKETGIIKGSIPITFFDERGNYNMNAFLGELNKKLKKNERFALICHTGSRSKILGTYLGGKQMGYNVIDLEGGIQLAIAKKLPIQPYKP